MLNVARRYLLFSEMDLAVGKVGFLSVHHGQEEWLNATLKHGGRREHAIKYWGVREVKNTMICLEVKSMTSCQGNTVLSHFSLQLPCLCLGTLKGFLRRQGALDLPQALLLELQRYGDGHRQAFLAEKSQHNVKNNYRKPRLWVCWKYTYFCRFEKQGGALFRSPALQLKGVPFVRSSMNSFETLPYNSHKNLCHKWWKDETHTSIQMCNLQKLAHDYPYAFQVKWFWIRKLKPCPEFSYEMSILNFDTIIATWLLVIPLLHYFHT